MNTQELGIGEPDELDEGDVDEQSAVFAPTDEVEGDSMIDEFVDVFNGRDLEGLAGLMAADVSADLVFANGSGSVVEGLESFFLREPSVMLTRGELASRPVAGIWHASDGDYVCVGYLVFEFTEEDPVLVSRIDLVDEIDSDDLLIEAPDDAELPEWDLDEDDWEAKGGEHL